MNILHSAIVWETIVCNCFKNNKILNFTITLKNSVMNEMELIMISTNIPNIMSVTHEKGLKSFAIYRRKLLCKWVTNHCSSCLASDGVEKVRQVFWQWYKMANDGISFSKRNLLSALHSWCYYYWRVNVPLNARVNPPAQRSINILHAAGMSRQQVKKCQHSEIWWQYLESL